MRVEFENIELAQMSEVASSILKIIGSHRLIALQGEMGMGKTTLTRAMVEKITGIAHATSPTFSLVNSYSNFAGEELIYHFDCYRLESPSDLVNIGYEEYFFSGKYCFIEWPELIKDFLPDETVFIYFNYGSDTNSRQITLEIPQTI